MTQGVNKARRALLSVGLTTAACAFSSPVFAARLLSPITPQSIRRLAFHNLHTDEKLNVTYWKDGNYDRAAWAQLNHILRDHYSGESSIMDLRLIDLVHDTQIATGNDRPIEIISGYRSPYTNAHLREATSGVAKNSFHMRGMAIDLRLNGTPLPHLHQTALALGCGGVGYYPDSEFVHMDVGPIRHWG